MWIGVSKSGIITESAFLSCRDVELRPVHRLYLLGTSYTDPKYPTGRQDYTVLEIDLQLQRKRGQIFTFDWAGGQSGSGAGQPSQ